MAVINGIAQSPLKSTSQSTVAIPIEFKEDIIVCKLRETANNFGYIVTSFIFILCWISYSLSLLLGISNLQLMFEKLYDSIGASSSSSPEFEFMLEKLILSGVEVLNQFSDVC